MERKKTGGRNRATGRTKEGHGIKYYILGLILEKYEKRTTKSDWRQVKAGNKSLKIQQEHYDDFGKTELIREIRELERQVLDQLYLETYAQSLELKGELKILLAGREVDLSEFPYGAVLNTETLKKVEIGKRQKIRKIITVENKANYMSMAYEKGTLILFCHGFFSPLERGFLVKLEKEVLQPSRQAGKEMEYRHTGDLDYGGVRIFRYIRTNIFPRLQPWQMDVVQYERYREYALEMAPSSREELKDMKEPLLQPLIDRIVAEGKVIEQECFLFEAIEGKNDL